MKTLQFNTGRLYQEHGQRIIAIYNPETCDISFWDISRTVSGTLTVADFEMRLGDSAIDNHKFLNEDWIMGKYDRGNYSFCAFYPCPKWENKT